MDYLIFGITALFGGEFHLHELLSWPEFGFVYTNCRILFSTKIFATMLQRSRKTIFVVIRWEKKKEKQ